MPCQTMTVPTSVLGTNSGAQHGPEKTCLTVRSMYYVNKHEWPTQSNIWHHFTTVTCRQYPRQMSSANANSMHKKLRFKSIPTVHVICITFVSPVKFVALWRGFFLRCHALRCSRQNAWANARDKSCPQAFLGYVPSKS